MNQPRDLGKELTAYMQRKGLVKPYQDLVKSTLADEEVQKFIKDHEDVLNEEMVLRSVSKLYEYVSKRDTIEKGEEEIDFLPKLIVSAGYIDVTYIPTMEYQEKVQENRVLNRVKLVSLPKALKEADFNDYDQDTVERKYALSKAALFTSNFIDQPKAFHKGLYLTGPFGVGKTYLLAAIANRLARAGIDSTLVHYPTFVTDMKAAINDNSTAYLMDQLVGASVLMIDDIGAETNSAWIRDDVLGVILQQRMQNQQATFFSSNFSMKELESHLAASSRGSHEPIKASRIMERIYFHSEEVDVNGPNRRH